MTGALVDPRRDDLLVAQLELLAVPVRPARAEPSLASVLSDHADSLAAVASLSGDLGLAGAGIERIEDAGDELGAGFVGALVVSPVGVGEGFEVGHVWDGSTYAPPQSRAMPIDNAPNQGLRY